MLTTTTPKVTYDCDAATVAFDFEFKMWRATVDDELVVTLIDADDVETVLTVNTDYTISAANNDYTSGGTVTTTETYAATYQLEIKSSLPRSQTYGLLIGGNLSPDSLEKTLDRMYRIIQELELDGGIEQTALSAFMKSVLDDTTAKAARATLLIYPVIQCYEGVVQTYENEVLTYVE